MTFQGLLFQMEIPRYCIIQRMSYDKVSCFPLFLEKPEAMPPEGGQEISSFRKKIHKNHKPFNASLL